MSLSKIIAVDLDGTLTFADTLYESAISLFRKMPYTLFMLPFWLLKGIAYLKFKVAKDSDIDVTMLPYNQPLIDWLRKEKLNGKKIILSTAANEKIAHAVVNHFEFLDEFIASDSKTNLKSANKRNALQERYGEKGYDYVGNSIADIEVWAGARNAIVVNASDRVVKKAEKFATVARIFPINVDIGSLAIWLKAFRVHQWLKNLLLFVPLLASHQIENIQPIGTLIIAFISFSLCASSVYILNDLLDLESDRSHPRKRFRPFASANLPISYGLALVPLLICVSIVLGAIVSLDFLNILLLYLLITLVYSLALKRLLIVDCLILATLYTIRIIAGAVAVSVPISFWLLAFSIFIFLSLALVKRHAELSAQLKEGKSVAKGRAYIVSDLPLLQNLGVSSGYISALVIALYLRSEDVLSLYSQPLAIWMLIPILLFWISWIWLKSSRGEMHDDPIVFAVRDKASLLVGATMAIVLIYAATGLNVS